MESKDFRNHHSAQRPNQQNHHEKKRIRIDKGVTIFRTRKSPYWYVQYNCPGEGQKKVSLGTTDPKAAMIEACKVVVALSEGKHDEVLRSPCTIAEAVESLLDDRRRLDRATGTLATYQGQLYQFVEFASREGVTRLDRVTPPLVRAFEKCLEEKGVLVPDENHKGKRADKNQRTTIYGKAKLVKTLLRFACDQKMISENPLTAYRLPAKGKSNSYAFTPEEVDAICEAAGPFFGTVFRFLALTGLRQGELIWLTKEDIYFDGEKAVIHIREKDGWRPKCGAREVPLSRPATAILREMLVAHPGTRWVFPAPLEAGVRDDRIRACRMCSQMKRARRLAGVKDGRVHSLRHFFVTSMADLGMLPFQLQALVGHKDIRVTLKYYHPRHQNLHSALEKFDIESVFKKKGDEK